MTADSMTLHSPAEKTLMRVAIAARPKDRGSARLVPLAVPAPLSPFERPALPGEGRWHAAGRRVQGRPAVFETTIRPPWSRYEAGIAWMDPRLLWAQLYSGSVSPGYGPWMLTAPISPISRSHRCRRLQWRLQVSGRHKAAITPKAASSIRCAPAGIPRHLSKRRRNGRRWGRDVKMSPAVIAVRQNLTLLVDRGRPVAGLNPDDTYRLGSQPSEAYRRCGVRA